MHVCEIHAFACISVSVYLCGLPLSEIERVEQLLFYLIYLWFPKSEILIPAINQPPAMVEAERSVCRPRTEAVCVCEQLTSTPWWVLVFACVFFSLQCELLIGAFLFSFPLCAEFHASTGLSQWWQRNRAEENQSSRRRTDVLTDSRIKHCKAHSVRRFNKRTDWMKLKRSELTILLCPCVCVCFLSVCLLVGPACDDECSGLLISDMDRLYRIITEVTLTTPLPPPYKMLYRFENMTEGLKVKIASPLG